MGMYDEYGQERVQLKVGPRELDHYVIGNEVDIDDGLYIGYEGVVVVQGGAVLYTGSKIFDKWGGEVSPSRMLDQSSPMVEAMKEMENNANGV